MKCAICGSCTEGSRGPASNYLRPLCSICAEKLDNELLQQCVAQSRQMDQVFDLLVNPRPVIEIGEVQ